MSVGHVQYRNRKLRVSSTILRFESYQKTQRIKSYVQKTKYNGTVHTIIENSGTNHFLTGTQLRDYAVSACGTRYRTSLCS